MMARENKITYIEDESEEGAVKKVEKLRKILKKCKGERQEYLEGWQRARADFQNYVKQKDAEMRRFKEFASQDVALEFIPILDNLILARESIPENIKKDNWAIGFIHIKKQFENVLRDNGIEKIEARQGDRFNPEYHEASEEVELGGESGTIAEILQRGYTIRGKVIRAVRVKVNK